MFIISSILTVKEGCNDIYDIVSS